MEKLNKEIARDMLLQAKDSKSLSWPQLAGQIGRSPVYTAMLLYGYGQATAEEADALLKALDLQPEIRAILMKVPHRQRRSHGRPAILLSTVSMKPSCCTGRFTRMWRTRYSATAS
jgi:cyanate lyase